MIQLEDLSMQYGESVLFEDGSFTVNDYEKIGLMGRNGTGKSTLLKIMTGEIEPNGGSVNITKGSKIGYLKQYLEFKENSMIEEVCSVLDEDRIHEGWKGEKILLGLGFKMDQMQIHPSKFSGGNQVKINLAKLLLMEPDILLLDEPTNYLDISSIRWLEKFLKNWPSTLILITHDRSFMDSVITHTVLIHRKKFKKIEGKTHKIKEMVELEEELHEKSRINQEKAREKQVKLIQRFGATASKAKMVQSRIKALDKEEVKIKLDDIQELEFDFNYAEYPENMTMLDVEKLTFGYSPDQILIDNFSFSVKQGDKICIIGKNGNGKSTLLKLLAEEMNPTSGKVDLYNKVTQGYFGQTNIERLDKNNTIVQELEESASGANYNTIRRVCSNMLFKNKTVEKQISVLSGGEKSRVMLGKIILKEVNMLLLDEPTNHFDMESCESLLNAIKRFQGSVIMVTHNEYFLREVANKLIIFDRGTITYFDGTYKSFLKKIGWSE